MAAPDTANVLAAQVPQGGVGPGLIVAADGALPEERLLPFARRFAEEGYVAVPVRSPGAPDEDTLEAAAAACRAHPAHRGMVGAVLFGGAATAGIAAWHKGLFECVVCHDPPDPAAWAPSGAQPHVLLHLPSAAPKPELPGAEVYTYADGSETGWLPGSRGAPAFAGIAFSRTLGLLRQAIGPHYDLSALWDAHRDCEFVARDADATMKTMVDQPYVNHVPTLIGGYGARDLHHFYARHFIPNNPEDMRSIPVSRTVGADRVVNETVLCFTHDREIEWMLPGIAPTHRYVEVALIGIISFRGGKLAHEHIYWDQASVLVQIGLLDPAGLPVAGAEAARKVLDPSLPSNQLLKNWKAPSGD